MLALTVLRHTPPSVFALLAYLLWQGARALRPRAQPLWRLLIAPSLFSLTSFALLIGRVGGATEIAAWGAALVLALPLGLRTGPRLLGLDGGGRVILAGSPVPLLRNLTIFILQYGVAVAAALGPASVEGLALARSAISGASFGYCLGFVVALHRGCRAQRREPSPSVEDARA